ncbi:MAG: chorismate-binding protein [Flavobacterium sp.]|nr:chorismate-binding protein [Flavobacterium sp.]
MTELLEKIQRQRHQKHAFVLFSLPESDMVSLYLYSDKELKPIVDFSECGFAFAPFNGQALYLPTAESDVFNAQITYQKNESDFDNSYDPELKQPFMDLVSKGINAIAEGEFRKVVSARREVVSYDKNWEAVLLNLFSSDRSAFRYCFYSEQTGMWMGATPEKLLSVTNRMLTTMSLAGTQPYIEDSPIEWGQKEIDEQQFVTSFIAESLADLNLKPELSDRKTARAGNIVHIRTDILAHVPDNINIKAIVNQLHPTPAVCGLPKAAALNFILREEENREYYSGYLGLLNLVPGDIDLYVNLRSMKIDRQKADIFVGCGVTSESDPESEFFETVNKSVAMKKILT